MGRVVAPIPVTRPTVQPENQPVPVSFAPISKRKKWQEKSDHLVRREIPTKTEEDEDEKGTSQEWEKEGEAELIKETETICPLKLSEI